MVEVSEVEPYFKRAGIMRIIKTVLADDHRIFTEGLQSVLTKDPECRFDIVGVVHNGSELIHLLKRWFSYFILNCRNILN